MLLLLLLLACDEGGRGSGLDEDDMVVSVVVCLESDADGVSTARLLLLCAWSAENESLSTDEGIVDLLASY